LVGGRLSTDDWPVLRKLTDADKLSYVDDEVRAGMEEDRAPRARPLITLKGRLSALPCLYLIKL